MMRRVFCTILFAVGYLGSMEGQEAPIPQLSPGSRISRRFHVDRGSSEKPVAPPEEVPEL